MAMKAYRVTASSTELLDPQGSIWKTAAVETASMVPAPLGMVAEISPYLAAQPADYGRIDQVQLGALHNNEVLSIRLSWKNARNDTLKDLNSFVDAVAVLFPLSGDAPAVTMGRKGAPVNAWYWKANHAETPYEVMAEGWGSSERRPGKASGLVARAVHADGKWTVVLQRALSAGQDHVEFTAGMPSRIALAVWNGTDRERSGRKSFSGEFTVFDIE